MSDALGLVTLWAVALAVAVGSFVLRASFILGGDRLALPAGARRALHFVPAAVLATLVFPGVAFAGGSPAAALANGQAFAACCAALVAWRTENLLATAVGGMAALWTFQHLVGTI